MDEKLTRSGHNVYQRGVGEARFSECRREGATVSEFEELDMGARFLKIGVLFAVEGARERSSMSSSSSERGHCWRRWGNIDRRGGTKRTLMAEAQSLSLEQSSSKRILSGGTSVVG